MLFDKNSERKCWNFFEFFVFLICRRKKEERERGMKGWVIYIYFFLLQDRKDILEMIF